MTQTPSDQNEDTIDTGRGSRLPDEDFAEACKLYEHGDMGIVEIADKFGVSRQALSQRFRNNNIIKGSKANVVIPAIPEPDTYTDKRATWIEDTRVQGYNALRTASMLARKIVQEQVRSGNRMEDVDGDLRAVQRYNKILVDNLSMTLELLESKDFMDPDELGILEISDLTEEEILEHHKSTGAIPEDATLEDLLEDNIIEIDL